jgi:hypothetical protein
MNLTSDRVDDGYLKVLIVAQAVVAEVLSELFAVLDGFQITFEVDPDPVSHRDAILHVEKELLHRHTSNRIKNRYCKRGGERKRLAGIPHLGLNDGGAFQRTQVAAQAPWHQGHQVRDRGSFALLGAHAHPPSQSDGSGFVPTGMADDRRERKARQRIGQTKE